MEKAVCRTNDLPQLIIKIILDYRL